MEDKKRLIDKIREFRERRARFKLVKKELKTERKKERTETKALAKTDKDKIKALKNEKKYDEIYDKYGTDIFLKNTPQKVKKAGIKKLMDEGRYTDIYEKYGYHIYKDYMYKIMAQDIYNETGSRPKSALNRIKNALIHRIAPTTLALLLTVPPVSGVAIGSIIDLQERDNGIKHQEEIENYNKKINKYANDVKGMNLTDIQIFMKLMDDLWKEIDGYKKPDEPDILGFFRLSIQNENVGVCRHFADDMTAKLNVINPEYNARNIVVHIDDIVYRLANIDRNIIDSNDTIVDENSGQDTELDDGETSSNDLIGNHMVTAVDIPGQNLTLILDPTNPGIGVFIDGKIHMFTTEDGRGIEPKMAGQFLQGLSDFADLGLTSIKSFKHSEYTLEELEEMYGTKAQNEALEYLAKLDTPIQAENDFVQKVTVNEKEAVQKITNSADVKDINELDKE